MRHNKFKINCLGLLTVCFFSLASSMQAQKLTGYENGLVVSAHPEATKVGLQILKQGGNAVDAAVAVQFALAVVYPNAGNIGGGGFMVYRAADGETAALDYREKAPGEAHRTMFQDENGEIIDGLSLRGGLASGVPGSVAGMAEAHKKYGKLAWEELLQPAINLAENGFYITENQAGLFNAFQKRFEKYNTGNDYLRKDNWAPGDKLTQRDLANTLRLIQKKGRNGFYKGSVAKKIVAEMKESKGMISLKDLKKYRAVWREPVIGDYKNHKVISMPPPSSGGIALVQLLNMVEPYNIGQFEHNSAPAIHLMAEAERRVYADRAMHLGDPDFYSVPRKQILSDTYLEKRMENFDPNKATPSTEIEAGKVTKKAAQHKESMETTHFSVVDNEGNAVAITTTINGNFGSLVFVDGAGFLLNNEMDDFSSKPGVPNMFGLVGGEANAIKPGKRMLSSMTPTILEKNGELFMVLGSPGGATIITTVFQTILNVVDFDMNIQQAVEAGRIHNQWLPDEIKIERRSPSDKALEKLKAMGHSIQKVGSIGSCDAILVENKKYYGGADPRGDDTALGY